MSATLINLLEITHSPSARVDRTAGIIRGVKVLGGNSKNRRVYTESAMRSAIGLYRGLAVNIDHPDRERPNKDRSVSDRFGQLENVRFERGGIFADLHFLKTHGLADQVCEAAERMPSSLGLSHNAAGRVERRAGRDVVEEIESVRSVDIVADPATTSGLFESYGGEKMSHYKHMNSTELFRALRRPEFTPIQKRTLQRRILREDEENRKEALIRFVREIIDDSSLGFEEVRDRLLSLLDDLVDDDTQEPMIGEPGLPSGARQKVSESYFGGSQYPFKNSEELIRAITR